MSTPDERGSASVRIVLEIPEKPTSGDLLRAMHQAYEAGERKGFGDGFIAGQRHALGVVDLTQRAMERSA